MTDAPGLMQPRDPASFAKLPAEILLTIIRLSLAAGRERDVSALARVNKRTYDQLNSELYLLVIKYRTFDIVHWAMKNGCLDTLKTALAHGADPNQIWAPSHYTKLSTPRMFRPAGWGLNTTKRFERALSTQTTELTSPTPPRPTEWGNSWFSAPGLSKVHTRELSLFWAHYLGLNDPETPAEEREDDARLYELSAPVQGSLTIPRNMPEGYRDQRDVKIRFLQLFRTWTYPLHAAALTDQHEAAQVLLASGADIDSVGVDVCSCHPHKAPSSEPHAPETDILVAYTPLHVAICSGKWETAKVLVAHGAQQLAKVFSGTDNRAWHSENALHAALFKSPLNYDFIEFLLNHGYDNQLEQRDSESMTPLGMACNSVGDPARDDVVRLLLRYGADIENHVPCHGQPVAAAHQNAIFHETATPAVWAALNGQFGLVRLLLDHGADAGAKTSSTQVTMLHAVCSKHGKQGITTDRVDLFDYLLANSTAEDVNAFDTAQDTPLSMLIKWNFRGGPGPDYAYMESELFSKGADIMAGMSRGKYTPFDRLIKEAIGMHYDGLIMPNEIYKKVLATLKASKIHKNTYRPVGILCQLWSVVGRALDSLVWEAPPRVLERIPAVLQALIGGGFSPTAVDRHGDTAMTSFLKYLIAHPFDVMESYSYDLTGIPPHGRLIQTIMAVLQEHGAGLHYRNKRGLTAFDYLYQIIGYNGHDRATWILAEVVGKVVWPGPDAQGNMCFKFHPTGHLFGSFPADDILKRMRRNPSRWLVCEHWCRHRRHVLAGASPRCSCARTTFQTPARCRGSSCEHTRRYSPDYGRHFW